VGGSIVNQSLGCFCLTQDKTETGTNFAMIHVYSGYIQMNMIFEALSLSIDCTMCTQGFTLSV
jgi:hypothetical protein